MGEGPSKAACRSRLQTTSKTLILSKFIRSITVHPENLLVEYLPSLLPSGPKKKGQRFLVIDIASPMRHECDKHKIEKTNELFSFANDTDFFLDNVSINR
jgi:hypothetical protein